MTEKYVNEQTFFFKQKLFEITLDMINPFFRLMILGAASNWHVSAIVAVIQTASKYRLLCVSNLLTEYPHCDVIVGIILDKPWSD